VVAPAGQQIQQIVDLPTLTAVLEVELVRDIGLPVAEVILAAAEMEVLLAAAEVVHTMQASIRPIPQEVILATDM
jgi:hypothetical protein